MIKPETRNQIIEYLEHFLETFLTNFANRFDPNVVARPRSSSAEYKPFHEAILSTAVKPVLAFERSFSTPLGTTFEECARLIGLDNFTDCKRQRNIVGQAPAAALTTIDGIDRQLRERGARNPNYLDLVNAVANTYRADLTQRQEKADLYVLDRRGNEIFFEMKTPEPNKSQCLSVTRSLLTIHAITGLGPPKVQTYYAMSYNPYGHDKTSYKWSFARNLLDMDRQVLLGQEFWDLLGGPGTYGQVIEIYQEVGRRHGKEVLQALISLQ